MSGPKTSQLEIERMIRAQLEALRSDVDHSRARARRRIAALLNELLDEAEGCAEAEEAAASAAEDREAAEKAAEGACCRMHAPSPPSGKSRHAVKASTMKSSLRI